VDSFGIGDVPVSGFSIPASSLTKVVFPMPFGPSMPITSPSPASPASTVSENPLYVFCIVSHSRAVSSVAQPVDGGFT